MSWVIIIKFKSIVKLKFTGKGKDLLFNWQIRNYENWEYWNTIRKNLVLYWKD